MQSREDDLPADRLHVTLLLILSVSMVSSASILIRFSVSHPLVIVFWRTFYGSIVMALIGLSRGELGQFKSPDLREKWPWLILIGVILSLHFSTWFTSLFMTTVAASVVLVDSSPIFTAILSTVILGESLGKKSWTGIFVAVSGAIFLAWSDLLISGPGALEGDLLALSGAIFLALYFIGGRKYARGLHTSIYTSVVYFTAAMTTLVICIAMQINVLVLELTEVLIFIALAIFPTALGHSVNNYLLTLVPAYVVSAAVLGEPIGASLLAVLLLNEIPPPTTLIGFVVILLGIILVLADLASRERSKISSFDNADRT